MTEARFVAMGFGLHFVALGIGGPVACVLAGFGMALILLSRPLARGTASYGR